MQHGAERHDQTPTLQPHIAMRFRRPVFGPAIAQQRFQPSTPTPIRSRRASPTRRSRLGAYYDQKLQEFLLPYEVVRNSTEPEQTLMVFLESTYRAAADLGHWDRDAL